MAKTTTTHKKYKGVIVSKTDMRKLKDELKTKMSEITDFLIFRFEQIGEECVKIARDNGSYHDITGNLRSSIGYAIFVDGKTVRQGAAKQFVGSQGDGAKGAAEGQALLNTLKSKFPWGVVLVICAGMEYAAYVEDIRHKDVLTSAEHVAERLVKELMGNLLKSA